MELCWTSQGVVDGQDDYCADNRHQDAVQIYSGYSMGSESAKDPSTCDRADNPQNNIEEKPLAVLIHNFAGDEPRDEA